MAQLKLTAAVLRAVDYGESDRVVTLFTRERGKVAAFARGARASRRRFGGALEPFTVLVAEVRERAGSDLLGLDGVSVLRSHGGIRGDLARIACAGYAAELARELVRDHEPHEDLFELLGAYFGGARLRAGAARRAPRLRARRAPRGRARAPARRVRLAAVGRPARASACRSTRPRAGLLCEACAPSASPAAAILSRAAAEGLLRLAAGGLPAADATLLPGAAGREARDALTRFIEFHLGRRLQARRFLDEVGPLLGA